VGEKVEEGASEVGRQFWGSRERKLTGDGLPTVVHFNRAGSTVVGQRRGAVVREVVGEHHGVEVEVGDVAVAPKSHQSELSPTLCPRPKGNR
jgi:hypothetical protein